MELLEGVMAFAVVMIILSTIATGLSEAILRLLATRQRVLAAAMKSLMAKEVLPRFGQALQARYGATGGAKGGAGGAPGATDIADLIARKLTLNPAGTPGDDPQMEDVDGGAKSLLGRIWMGARRGIETLTTHSFIQRIAKTEVADALIGSVEETIAERLLSDRTAKAVAAAGPQSGDRVNDLVASAATAEAEERARRKAAADRRAAANARLRDRLHGAVEEITSTAAGEAANLAADLAERAAVDLKARLRLPGVVENARALTRGTRAEALVDDLLAEVEAIAAEEEVEAVRADHARAAARVALAEAYDAAVRVAESPAVKTAVADLAAAAGHVLGDAAADLAEEAEAAVKARLNVLLNDLSRTFERYVAAANETFRANAHVVTVIVSFLLCFGGNIDAGRVFSHLMEHPEARRALIEEGEAANRAYEDARAKLEETRARIEAGDDVSMSEEEIMELSGLLLPLKELTEERDLPIGVDYYPYCGSLETLFSGDGSTCAEEVDRTWFTWLLNILIAGALVSMGGPFWYRVFSSLSQLTQIVRKIGGGGRPEKIDAEATDQQPASAKALAQEDMATIFLTAHAGKAT